MSRTLLGVGVATAVLLGGAVWLLWDTRAPSDGSKLGAGASETSAVGNGRWPAETNLGGESAKADSGAATRPVPAAELLKFAVERLAQLPAKERDAFVAQLISQLRAAGPAGLRAAVDFLRSGRDVPLRDEYGLTGNRVTSPSSLRIALLDAMATWEGSAGALLDFLRSPASVWEVILAIRNLELQYPSTYRAESVAALRTALARPRDAQFGDGGEAHLFATVARLNASSLLPEVEKVAIETSNIPRYLELLRQMPDAQPAAVQSILNRPEVADEIEAAPQTLNQWSLRDPQVRAFLGNVFRARLLPEQRVAALDAFEAASPILAGEHSLLTQPQNAREAERAAAAEAIQEAQARKDFLAELASDPAQPQDVQAAAKDAQKRITQDLAARQTGTRAESDPLVEVGFADGAGRAQIKGRRIEAIDLQPANVVEPVSSEDSTD